MEILLYIFIFFLGLSAGSFMNVLVFRLGTGLGFKGRSFCFSCGKKLSWYELIPLVSFLVQGGRCRSCRAKISWQYPVVEFISGVLFVGIFWKLGFSNIFEQGVFGMELFAYYAIAFSLLVAIVIYDIRHKIIPNQFVYLFIALAFLRVLNFENFDLIGNWKLEIENLISGPIFAAPFAFFWLVSKGRWMGLGDAKFAWGIGWFLGLSNGFSAILLSFWIGALSGLLLIGAGKFFRLLLGHERYTMKSEIPFAPFMVLGTALVFFFDIPLGALLTAFMVF